MCFTVAKEVISAAHERQCSYQEVLLERFPPGPGGVGHANARTRRETLKRIREWLEPGEPNEPTYGGACG